MNTQIELGTNVLYCGRFQGTVIEVCGGKLAGMVVIRLDRGTTCVPVRDLKVVA
jgi:hypothetical protein